MYLFIYGKLDGLRLRTVDGYMHPPQNAFLEHVLWLWPLNSWPWKLHQFVVRLYRKYLR